LNWTADHLQLFLTLGADFAHRLDQTKLNQSANYLYSLLTPKLIMLGAESRPETQHISSSKHKCISDSESGWVPNPDQKHKSISNSNSGWVPNPNWKHKSISDSDSGWVPNPDQKHKSISGSDSAYPSIMDICLA
jgi:hypothetical protein